MLNEWRLYHSIDNETEMELAFCVQPEKIGKKKKKKMLLLASREHMYGTWKKKGTKKYKCIA